MDVADRVVLITGASSGVGAALATQLGEMGARVVVNYSRSAEAAEAVNIHQKALLKVLVSRNLGIQ